MDMDKDILCEAVKEAFRKLNVPLIDEAFVRLLVNVAIDCFDLGYEAGKRAAKREHDV